MAYAGARFTISVSQLFKPSHYDIIQTNCHTSLSLSPSLPPSLHLSLSVSSSLSPSPSLPLSLQLLKALSGEANVVECGFVKSDITEASYFATPLLLGKNGLEKNLGYGTLSDFEKKKLEEVKKIVDH